MRCRLRDRREHDEGFSMVELLIVVIIIGILAAIAIPVFLHQRDKGYEASEQSDLRNVAEKVEAYNTDVNDYSAIPFGSNVGAGATHVISGTSTEVGNDTVSLSKGNTLTLLAAGKNGFCLSAVSDEVGASTHTWFYDSLHGGLTKTACPSSGTSY